MPLSSLKLVNNLLSLKTMAEKKLVLLDGSSYLYRAYFATAKSRLSSPSGQPTGAIFAIINMIKKLRNHITTII